MEELSKELSKGYEPKEVEDKIYEFWQKTGYFNPDKLPKRCKKPYSIVIPPPNVTGNLHMGHALNATIQDILIRWKRLNGYKTLWLPGMDHAGIAAQNVVEKKLRKQGLSRFDLGREKMIEKIWEWKGEYGDIILNQLKKIGSSCDWSRTRFTLDDEYAKAVKIAFARYYKKGWIYQGERIVNWCPRCQTSLSDLEIEHKEEKGHLWYIKYPLLGKFKKFIVVATTRPETMLGDTGVAVNPKDKRYENLIGKKVVLPLVNREIPIVADRLIDKEFGTGAVKITPAHDLNDYEIGLRHNLGSISIINERAKLTEKVPIPYQGLSVKDAREKVIKDLEKLGLLEKIEDYTHQVPKCYRCNRTIELILSKQWFLKMDKLAGLAIRSIKNKNTRFQPKRWEKPYFDWLKNVRDWCISRQIWWGHRLPIWQCQNKDKQFLSLEKPKKCEVCGKCKPEQISDVLDTWFSSALWPFAALGWPEKTKDLREFYPTNVLSTARDIINLWVARMIFSGDEFIKKEPFKDIYIHATVLTRDGKRMSKSLGTGINPMGLIERYGADATRFGIIWQVTENQDLRFVEDNIVMGKKFCNKIWNASRFVMMQVGKQKLEIKKPKIDAKNLTLADKRILKKLDKTIKDIDANLEKFQFGKAAQTLYDFFWHDFCDKYIEVAKKQDTKETKNTLLYVLLSCLKLLHPFVPFVTEEIYQKLPIKNKEKSLMIEKWSE